MEKLRRQQSALLGAVFGMLALCNAPAAAECLSPPPADAASLAEAAAERIVLTPTLEGQAVASAGGRTWRDRIGRVVAPVFVNGEGPFRFVVDTGANRSVLSARLANRLGLTPVGQDDVHSIEGVRRAPMVEVNTLTYGPLSLLGQRLPVLDGGVFAGELGLLGVDGMAGRRLRMNFRDNCIEITDARDARPLRGWGHAPAELRFGHLLLSRARVRGAEFRVLIDTGSDATLGNRALRDLLWQVRARRSTARTGGRGYTATRPMIYDNAVVLPRLMLGDVEISNVVAFIGDYHIFDLWGLNDEPIMLLGMDVLSQTEEVVIDYERGALHFRVSRARRSNASAAAAP